MSPERWPYRDARSPDQIQASLVAGRQDQKRPDGATWHGPHLDSKGLWESPLPRRGCALLGAHLPALARHFFFLSFGVSTSFVRAQAWIKQV